MDFIKRLLSHYLYIIRYLSLVVAVFYIVFSFVFFFFYFLAAKDFNFMIKMLDGNFPWSLISKPSEYFFFSGKVFTIGLVEYFFSCFISKYLIKLK